MTYPLHINRVFRRLFAGSLSILGTVLILLLSSCSNSDEPSPEPDPLVPTTKVMRTVLIYSVAANDLQTDLKRDSVEMTLAAPAIRNLEKEVRVLLYMAPLKGLPTLSELTCDRDGKGKFNVIKTYSKDIPSTHPDRLSGVIEDVRTLRPAYKYGIILESHATGWSPDFNTHSKKGVAYSFGADLTGGQRDSIDLLEMDEAIPADTFDFIWFDACYMGSVEVAYQLRDKAEKYIGYVTEIGSNGMPYDLTLPHIAKREPDYEQAASTLFSYYNDYGTPVSVSILDLSRMEALAEATAPLVSLEEVPYPGWLQKYSRGSVGPFYDFGQFALLSGNGLGVGEDRMQAFEKALSDAVVYKAISAYDFNRNPLSKENYSGLSCHVPGYANSSDREDYYRLLDWAKAIYR